MGHTRARDPLGEVLTASLGRARMLSGMHVRLALVAIAATLLGACGSSAARPASPPVARTTTTSSTVPARASAPICGPARARTLASDRRARVYTGGDWVYACAAGARTRQRLGLHVSCLGGTRVGPFALSGEVVAYAAESCGVDTGRTSVLVRRLSTGRQLASAPALSTPLGPESYTAVSALALAGNGDAAWIAVGRAIVAGHSATAVMALDGRGEHQLDSGTAIATRSLQLHGRTVRWRDGGSWRTAQLS